MHFSDRVRSLRESSTLAVSARAAALRARGEDVIGFGAGEPDFDTPEPIRAAAIAALNAGKTRYTATAGEITARRAIASKLERENGVACTADDVVITVGAKHAIYLSLQCLLDPGRGQEVILPTPAWVSYRPLIELAGGRCIELPTSMESGFRIDPAALAAAITPRTTAVILNSPSNPCGIALPPGDIEAIATVLAARPDIVVISDEIYEKLIYPEITPGLRHLSPGSLPALRARTITINGLSKAFAMTGWRIGYLAAPSGSGFAAEVAKLQGQMTNNITSFVYDSIVTALEMPGATLEAMRAAFAERAKVIDARLRSVPGLECVAPNAAFYAFPRVRSHFGTASPGGRLIDSAAAFAEALLDEAKVAVVPGEDFGDVARDHVRLSFACGLPAIEKGVDRIGEFCGSLRRVAAPVGSASGGE